MTDTLTVPTITTADLANDLDHVICCELSAVDGTTHIAFCGVDVTNTTWVNDVIESPNLCAVCAALEATAFCPRHGGCPDA